jgi:hypothetical protein
LGAVLSLAVAACTSTVAGSGSAGSSVSPTSQTTSSSSSSSESTSSSSDSSSSSATSTSRSSSSSRSSTSDTSSTSATVPPTFGPDTPVTDLLWGSPLPADAWTITKQETGVWSYNPAASCEVTFAQPAGLTDDASDQPDQVALRYTERALESFAAAQGVTDLPNPSVVNTDGMAFALEPRDGLPATIDFVGLRTWYPLSSAAVTTQAYVLRVGEYALVLTTACHDVEFDANYSAIIAPIVLASTVDLQP